MYAVIFKATIAKLDEAYFRMAENMKNLAFSQYGCIDFVAVTEGDNEVAISYWESEQQILAWKNDPQHGLAQQAGRDKWYRSYSVEICKVGRSYKNPR